MYDSEINFSVSSFWDGGFDVKLGDALNGYVAGTTCATWGEVERWLAGEAYRNFPQSDFAKTYRL